MLSTYAPAEARPIVRCQACTLNQFLPSTGACRRCHRTLGNYQLVIPISSEPATLDGAVRSFRQTVGRFLRAIRIERGLTQRQLAICLHTHRSFISRVECGHKFPPLSMLAHAGFLMGLDKVIVILR
jgi:DNA-binding XRE family transcriptional regulator